MLLLNLLLLLMLPAHPPPGTIFIEYGSSSWYITPEVRSDDTFEVTLYEVQSVCIDLVTIYFARVNKNFVKAAIVTGKLNEFLAARTYLVGSGCRVENRVSGNIRYVVIPRQIPGPRNLGAEAWLTPK